MALVYNCKDDVAVAAFISGLQVTHSFYKHLVKYEVTKMRDIFIRAQKYIQIEDVTRASANCLPKHGVNRRGNRYSPVPHRRLLVGRSELLTSQLKTSPKQGDQYILLHSKFQWTRCTTPSRAKTSLGIRDHYLPTQKVQESESIAPFMTVSDTAPWIVALSGDNFKSWWIEDITKSLSSNPGSCRKSR